MTELAFRADRRRVNGTEIHFVTGGSGDPLLLVHGWPQTSREWARVMPALAEHHALVVPDYRGAGASDIPASGYDKKTMAEDLYQLMQSLGLERFDVVGHDVGAMVSYALAREHPEAVRRLVLAEALIPGLDPGWEDAMDNSAGEGAWFVTFNTVPEIPEALVAGREDVFFGRIYREVAYDKTAITEEDVAAYVETFRRPGALRASFEVYRAIFDDVADNQGYSGKLPMPVLSVGGGGAVSVGDALHRSLVAVAEDLTGVLIPDCGHWVAEEKPEKFARVVLDFLGTKAT